MVQFKRKTGALQGQVWDSVRLVNIPFDLYTEGVSTVQKDAKLFSLLYSIGVLFYSAFHIKFSDCAFCFSNLGMYETGARVRRQSC